MEEGDVFEGQVNNELLSGDTARAIYTARASICGRVGFYFVDRWMIGCVGTGLWCRNWLCSKDMFDTFDFDCVELMEP